MSVIFVHLSDIHFGQERGGDLRINNDVKEHLIEDVACVSKTLGEGPAAGVIVTGDIAFRGLYPEYRDAGDWLDRVANAAGCARHRIQLVPGNHDIDRGTIGEATRLLLNGIVAGGDSTLDRVLAADDDRELLFRRFSAYRPFSEGYRCPLNTNAEPEEWVIQLAPGRSLRFVRLNSALVCSADDERGKLLLGARQRVLQPVAGQELVVLCHHPLHWLQDSEDARRFIRNRARVFMSGHEHAPSFAIEGIADGKDLMMLSAGAAVPPNAGDDFTYRYNFVKFEWVLDHDALSVTVLPRVWRDHEKTFGADDTLIAKYGSNFVLGCPFFRRARREATPISGGSAVVESSDIVIVPDLDNSNSREEADTGEEYASLLLAFFRDLTSSQRADVLVAVGALPENWRGPLNESIERRMFDRVVHGGRIDEVRKEITQVTSDDT